MYQDIYNDSMVKKNKKNNGFQELFRLIYACLMVFNATFNNISVISWRSVLLVEETAVPRENHRPVVSH